MAVVQRAKLGAMPAVDWAMRLGHPGEALTELDELGQAIDLVLLTPLGAMPLRPLFGSRLREVLARPIDRARVQAPALVVEALKLWEPRVVVDAVRLVPSALVDGQVAVELVWHPAAGGAKQTRTVG